MKRKDIIETVNEQTKIKGVINETKKTVKEVVSAVLESEHENDGATVSVTFVDNERIRELNREFRNIDRATDVLSFPADEPVIEGRGRFLGDIALSLERAKTQSEEYGHSFKREVAFLTAHSVLHLLGYDHMTPDEEKEMFSKQEKVLNDMGIAR